MHLRITLAAIAALAMPAAAQLPCGNTAGVTVTVSPQNAAPGQMIRITITNNSRQTISLPTSCSYRSVHPGGSCSNPPVFGTPCLQVITSVPPGTSRTTPWNQQDNNQQQVPNGTYGILVRYFGPSGADSCCPTVTIGCGTTASYGRGCPDSRGRTASLTASGCPAPGGSVQFGGRGGPPNAVAALVFGFGRGRLPITPACAAEIAPLSGLGVPLTLSSTGAFTLTLPIRGDVPTLRLTAQMAALDASGGTPALTLSNAVEVLIP